MPHSSGGGSHSGGSSGGGHHSSGGSSDSVRTSNQYFSNSYRYVRYANGHPEYIYSSASDLNEPPSKGQLILLRCFLIPFIIVGIWLFVNIYQKPKPLKTNYNPSVSIEDVIDVFNDTEEQELTEELEKFVKKTGVPVTILTVPNDAWDIYYHTLETYAYDVYVNKFSDEDHWLIVYSDDGIDRQGDEFCDWYFEGMQGDNTDPVLTEGKTRAFNDNLTKLLMQKSNTTAEAFLSAFRNLTADILKPSIHPEFLGVAILWNAFVWFVFFSPTLSYKKYKDYTNCGRAEEESTKGREETCEYCGGVYYRGTVLNCPHCGASISRHDSQTVSDLKKQYDV